jgi:hypothetical protein
MDTATISGYINVNQFSETSKHGALNECTRLILLLPASCIEPKGKSLSYVQSILFEVMEPELTKFILFPSIYVEASLLGER